MANIRLQALKPKTMPILGGSGAVGGLDRELRNFIGRAHAEMATYPDQMPTRSGYIRSGDYGRGWTPELSGSPSEVRLVNRVNSTSSRYQTKTRGVRRRRHKRRAYASFVGGKGQGGPDERQAGEMHRRQWKRIDEVAKRLWPSSRSRIIRILGGNV